jgi:hypothetical protein
MPLLRAGNGLPRQPVHPRILAAGAARPGPAHGEHGPAGTTAASARLAASAQPARGGSASAGRCWRRWPALAQFVGHPAYGLAQLRGDLQRFIFLLGGSDGAALFGPDTAQ